MYLTDQTPQHSVASTSGEVVKLPKFSTEYLLYQLGALPPIGKGSEFCLFILLGTACIRLLMKQ